MKAYVLYYGPEPPSSDETPSEREKRLAKPSIIQFGPEPLWKLSDKYLADVELAAVQRGGFFVGPHFCEFAVEELPEGEFALVCLNHPVVDPWAPLVRA